MGRGGPITDRARGLRRDSTEAERLLWYRLRARRFGGVKFRRQKPVGGYFVDFVSTERRLVIELDGGSTPSSAKRTGCARAGWSRAATASSASGTTTCCCASTRCWM